MPQTGQIIPTHLYPHNMVVVNDNTEFKQVLPEESDDSIKMLFVFSSPKGRENQLVTIENGLKGFVEEFGQGPFTLYGQPYLNAYQAFSTGSIVGHCLRVMPQNASYAYAVISAFYKVDDAGEMTIRLRKKTGETLTDLDDLDVAYTPSGETIDDTDNPDNGFKEVKLATVAYLGKGTAGRKIQIGVSTNVGSDKENPYKNYIVSVYENAASVVLKEQFAVCFNEDALIDDTSLFADGVIGDPDTGSNKIKWVTNLAGFQELFDAYKDQNPDTVLTFETFDPLLGINKLTRQGIANLKIDTTSEGTIALNAINGIPLEGGDDGDLADTADPAVRQAALDNLYEKAFAGELDPMIKSKNRFPVNLILDANYPVDAKLQLAALVEKRLDCGCVLDCGLGIKTKNSPITYVKNNLDMYARHRNEQIDAICGKLRDPYSKKIVTCTNTVLLASAYPLHWAEYGGKHVALAGNNFGVIDGFIKDTIYPIFDEDLDDTIMDEMALERINYARINAKQQIVRATQTTRQVISSNLSEASNVFLVLDVKRDCERLCDTYQYNFADPEDIRRFNRDAEDQIVSKYQDTQLKDIQASFDKNDWEAARGILHLYVSIEHKDIVKTSIIEIDVNRTSNSNSSGE